MQEEIDDLRAALTNKYDANDALQQFVDRLKQKDNAIFERD